MNKTYDEQAEKDSNLIARIAQDAGENGIAQLIKINLLQAYTQGRLDSVDEALAREIDTNE